jgi:hypothetical protein
MAANQVLLIADYDGCHFEIQEGRGEGFYVWRFVGESTASTHDHLQEDLAMARRCALHEWGVPESAWRPLTSLKDSRLWAATRGPGQ